MGRTEAKTALLLDGRDDDDMTLTLLHEALVDGLTEAGWVVDDWHIREQKMAWCSGCFGCWVKTPGECVYKDASHEGNQRASRADLLVILTPVTFGGYSAEAKKALDHSIGIHLPYLKKLGTDTHHPPRYHRRHDLLAVGTVPAGQGGGVEAETFRRLVERNILNLYPGRQVNAVVESGAGEAEVRAEVARLLAACGITSAVREGVPA
jgi:multimeric flavodoxin WrbA